MEANGGPTVAAAATAASAAEDAATGAVDLEAMIEAFVADDSSESLELPRTLTAEQRKQAKKIADQNPKLKCESYGFGEERRLHLFKKEKDKVRVKNTFIDDWEAGDNADAHAMFKSMPDMPIALLERTMERARAMREGTDAAPIVTPQKAATSSSGQGSPTNCVSPDRSGPDRSPAGQSSAASSAPELPPMPGGMQVRNTFIHIESVKDVDRIVKSMPHGMFRQCLEAELSAQNPTSPTGSTADSVAPMLPVPVSAVTDSGLPVDETWMVPGTEVIIQGLIKLPDFNGLRGVVQSLDEASGRYDILLEDPAGQCGWRWVKVKSDNCRLSMPPPPSAAPNVSNVVDQGSPPPHSDATRTNEGSPPPHSDATRANEVPSSQGGCATPLKLNALV